MSYLDPYDFFPCAAIGWARRAPRGEVFGGAGAVGPIYKFDHQTGGYGCNQNNVAGVLFPLPDGVLASVEIVAGNVDPYAGDQDEEFDLGPWNQIAMTLGWPRFTRGEEALISTSPIAIDFPPDGLLETFGEVWPTGSSVPRTKTFGLEWGSYCPFRILRAIRPRTPAAHVAVAELRLAPRV